MFKRMDHVGIVVNNIDESLETYAANWDSHCWNA